MDEIQKDERFKHIVNDSRFRTLKRNERKVKIDQRFKKMFHDKQFKLKYSVDKRGKPIELTTNENLKKFYELSEEEEEEEEEDEKKKKVENKIEADKEETTTEEDEAEEEEEEEKKEEESENDDEDDTESDEDETESSTDEEDSAIDEGEEIIPWNEFDKDTERNDDISSRLAICNIDWDRLKAEDLFVLLNSFKPANGIIKSIKIYLSDFGAERMEYEKLNGPQELTKSDSNKTEITKKKDNDEQDDKSEDDDGDDEDNIDRLKLRTYQFNRLKYYYAVVECDSSETANRIYTECDGMEYESSCNRLDLRFIPDDVTFEENRVTQTCVEMPDPLTYKPNLFFTTALNQTKVECTWDETPRDRLAVTMKKYTEEELKDSNFKNLLASGSEDEEEQQGEEEKEEEKVVEEKPKKKSKKKNDEEDEGIQKYKELLFGSEEKLKSKREADLEFSWEGGADEYSDDSDDEDLLVSKKKLAKANEAKPTKKKELTEEEKKEQAQLSLLTIDDNDAGRAHFNLDDLLLSSKNKKVKSKKDKKKGESEPTKDDFELNVNDPRFSAIFFDHKFNIDPSDQMFKRTKAMENLLDEKTKRKFNQVDSSDKIDASNGNDEDDDNNNNAKSAKVDPSAQLLVKSIKSRNEALERRRQQIKEKQKALKNKLRLLK